MYCIFLNVIKYFNKKIGKNKQTKSLLKPFGFYFVPFVESAKCFFVKKKKQKTQRKPPHSANTIKLYYICA